MKTHLARLAFNLALIAGAATLVVLAGCNGPVVTSAPADKPAALSQAHCDTINGAARPVGCQ